MFRVLMIVLTSRYTIGLLSLVICVPMLITLTEVSKALWSKPDLKEEMEIVTGIGIIMIGWGVLLEERKTVREIFGLLEAPDEAWQELIDHKCHNYGVGQLSIGLMAEICIELIKIPNTIIYTGGRPRLRGRGRAAAHASRVCHVLLAATVGHGRALTSLRYGSISTPGFIIPFGSSSRLAPRSARANSSGRCLS
jgi:hypothetical protein